jgi:hypothetical protein
LSFLDGIARFELLCYGFLRHLHLISLFLFIVKLGHQNQILRKADNPSNHSSPNLYSHPLSTSFIKQNSVSTRAKRRTGKLPVRPSLAVEKDGDFEIPTLPKLLFRLMFTSESKDTKQTRHSQADNPSQPQRFVSSAIPGLWQLVRLLLVRTRSYLSIHALRGSTSFSRSRNSCSTISRVRTTACMRPLNISQG